MTDNANPQELLNYDLERIKGYKELLDFYHGRHWEGRPRFGEKRLTLNYAKVFIDKITSYVMSGMGIAAEALENTSEAKAKAKRAEEALRQVYEVNNLAQLDFETEIDGSVLGDACFKVIWDGGTKSVRVTAPDVQGIYAWWRGDDISKVWRVASRYTLSVEESVALYQVRPKGKTVTVTEFWADTEFELYLDNDLIEKKPNPYGFIPFIIFPNLREPKRFWGISDLPQIMEVQKELNRAVSQLARILELSGNPIAVLENVEASEDIAVKPGAVWNIPEAARAYLLDLLQGGGVKLHIDYIELLYRALHDISESPRAAFGGIAKDLSGVALEIELQPLIQKIQRKRLIRTAVYNRRNHLILRLLEKYQNEDFGKVSLRIVWSPVLPKDLARMVANEQVLVQSGIHSRRHAMDELGILDAESEFQRWLEERESILKMNKRLEGRSSRSESESKT